MRATAVAAATLSGSVLAHAALWGYVDADGVAHFAERQLDSRYGLVIGDDAARKADKVPGKAMSPSAILTWLEIAPEVRRVQPWVREAAAKTGVDGELINALIAVESGFDERAVSRKGAVGLMQIMPATAAPLMGKGANPREIAARLAEPRTNIGVGARLIAQLLERHRRIDLALAAWSAGSEAVRRSGGALPPIDETRAHVQQVLELYWVLLQRRHSRGAQQLKLHP
ncbi:MAG: Membrane-bound lytic murein transglycosylase C [Burkholderiaceae bacterium]|nr:Membrane-bound lytic murein transglycosylase C [Burkholderiaceae bacterium]